MGSRSWNAYLCLDKDLEMKNKKMIWFGRILSVLVSLQFAYSALAKIFPSVFYPEMTAQMEKIGLPLSILTPVAILEILCIITYLIPATAVLGAVLFTGYLGGAMLTHLRVGESVSVHVMLGGLIWLGIYVREPRLWDLLPIRKRRKEVL
jgi:hypothetical protein